MSSHARSQRFPVTMYLWPLLLLLGLGAVLLWRFWPGGLRRGLDPDATPRAITPRGDLAGDEKSTIELFNQASRSAAHITTLAVRPSLFGFDGVQIPRGTGSGFVWDNKGHIVTNYHVIQGADAAQVTLGDQSSYRAKLVGSYPDKDLAVLVIDAPAGRLRPIPIGSSHDLQVGQKAFAIGNPYGLDRTLTTGVVSALGRQIESVTRRTIKDMIQTDAAINPGNSGGPLLDSAGRLIGVNTAIYSSSGSSAGIGFAIPVDEVNRVVPQLIRAGKVTRAGLGVRLAPDQLSRQLGLKGALVFEVEPDSPAAKSGIRPTHRDSDNHIHLGDLIVTLNDKPVRSANDLRDLLEQLEVGTVVRLTVLREGQEQKLTATLTEIDSGGLV